MSKGLIDRNLTSLFEDMVRVLDGSVERRPWGTMHRAFPANPMFNGVWTEPNPEAEWHDAVGEALAFFAEDATPLVFWWVTDATASSELQVALADHGFVPFELDAPVLVGQDRRPQSAAGTPERPADTSRRDRGRPRCLARRVRNRLRRTGLCGPGLV